MATLIGTPTDQDILNQIANDDEYVNAITAAFQTLGSKVPQATLVAWQSDLASYTTWSTAEKSAASGGFFAGQWWGVGDSYLAAVNWGNKLKNYVTTANGLGAQTPTLPDVPAPPSTPGGFGGTGFFGGTPVGADTKVLIGLGLVALIMVARKL